MRTTDLYEELCSLADERGWTLELGHRPIGAGVLAPIWYLRVSESGRPSPIYHQAQALSLNLVLDQLTRRVTAEARARHWT